MEKKTRYAAQKKYNKKNLIRKEVQFNKNTNSEMIDFVEKKGNFNSYIKDLISEDMKKNEQ